MPGDGCCARSPEDVGALVVRVAAQHLHAHAKGLPSYYRLARRRMKFSSAGHGARRQALASGAIYE
jgi:hypothetical protein